jgi:hypothetical protein
MNNSDRPLTRLERKQQTLADMVRMICRKQYHALFVSGFGGGGKTRTMTTICEEEGQDLVVFNSHVTPLALYGIIHEYRNSESILLFDDADALYQNKPALGLLRSCLYGQPERVVTWSSSQLPEGLPPRFTTVARFMFSANQVPKKCPIFDAMTSRCLTYRMDVTNSEVLEHFRVMSANGWPGCNVDQCEQVIDFIEEQAEDRQLSMRLLAPAVRIYKYANEQGTDWRPILLAQLHNLGTPTTSTKRISNRERDERVVREAIRRHPDSTTEQCDFYKDKSGKSQASFYRVLKRLRETV